MYDFGQDVCFTRDDKLFRLRAAAVIIKDNQVLMAGNDKTPYLYSIGGAVHLGESIEDALKREVWEETGADLKIVRLLVIHQNFFQDKVLGHEYWHELSFYYLMDGHPDVATKPLSKNMINEAEYLRWVPLASFHETHAFPTFFSDLENILNDNRPRVITTYE